MTEHYFTGISNNEIVLKTNKSLDLNSNLRKTRRMIVHFDWFRNKWRPLFTESARDMEPIFRISYAHL